MAEAEERVLVFKYLYNKVTDLLNPVTKAQTMQEYNQSSRFIVEKFGSRILFAPYREDLKIEDLYCENKDSELFTYFKSFTTEYGLTCTPYSFYLAKGISLADLKRLPECFFLSSTIYSGRKSKIRAWNDFTAKNIVAFGYDDATVNNYTDEELSARFDTDTKDPEHHHESAKIKKLRSIKYGDLICCHAGNYGLYGIGVALSTPKLQKHIHQIGITDAGEPEYYDAYVEVAWLKNGDNYKNKYIPKADLKILKSEKVWFGRSSFSYKNEIPNFIYRYLLNEDLPHENAVTNSKAEGFNNTSPDPDKLPPSSNESTEEKEQTSYQGSNPRTNQSSSSASSNEDKSSSSNENNNQGEDDQNFQSTFTQNQSTSSKAEANADNATINDSTSSNDPTSNSNAKEEQDLPISELAQELKEQLLSAKNLVLTGVPGTGKTYLASEIIAKALKAKKVELVQFHPSYDYVDFVEGMRPSKLENGEVTFVRTDGIFKQFCKDALADYQQSAFPSFNEILDELIHEVSKIQPYEIPIAENDHIQLCLNKDDQTQLLILNSGDLIDKKLLFEVYCRKSHFDEEQKFVFYVAIVEHLKNKFNLKELQNYTQNCPRYLFIIDEFNRGYISKIFGELLHSIDPGCRGKKVITQYQNMLTDRSDPFYEGFFVPENVYIICTMNNIDSSVETIGFALRRRFGWYEVKASENTSMLDPLGDKFKDAVIAKMKDVNNAIYNEEDPQQHIAGLNQNYHIGGAYFLKIKDYLDKDPNLNDEQKLKDAYDKLWNTSLEPLIREYLKSTLDPVSALEAIKNAYYSEAKDPNEG